MGLAGMMLGAVVNLHGAQEQSVWEVESLNADSPFKFDLQRQTLVATNGAVVTYHDARRGDIVLTAQRIQVNQASGEASAEGGVNLRSDNQLWIGERLQYNFITKQIQGDEFRTGLSPVFVKGQNLTMSLTNQTYSATNAVITTDDVAEPGFQVRARKIIIIPGKSVSARNAVLYAGKMPVMYFPYYERKLSAHPNNWVLEPGYRSLYGPYLLAKYNFYLLDNFTTGINADYRMDRGFGYGPDISYDLGKAGKGDFRFYNTHDKKPANDPNGKPITDDRQRVSFNHLVEVGTNFTAKVVLREQSDAYIVRDFYEEEYRKNVQPSSYAEATQLWRNWSLDILAQPQVNDFNETVERLPDVKLTGIRQQLGVSPFYYESDSSAGWYRYKFADDLQPEYSAARADTYHQIVLPKNFFGWLNVTPRVGGRFTYYSEAEGDKAVTEEQYRTVFNTGVEFSTKVSKVYHEPRSKFLDINEVRHIVEPSVNYVYVPDPSVAPRELPQFDSELPSYAMMPIEYPDYNSIDSIDSQNVLRFGLKNKLQTKRKDKIDNVVDWAVYTDWRVRPREDQTTFADIYSSLDFKPRQWITLTSETRYDMQYEQWRMANHYLTIQPGNDWSWSIGHRYYRTDQNFTGYNLIMSRVYYRLNENWGVRMSHYFEAKDGIMEEQSYSVYRDLRSWTAALVFRIRDNLGGTDDYMVGVTMSLKAFPRFGMGTDSDTPWTLLD
jgi:lipopolysaccharide assembly outer membrane protein LptD (OstA)